MTSPENLRARIERAHTEIGDLAAHGRPRWRMTIPADPGRDSDLILSDGLAAGEEAVSAVERVRVLHCPEQPPPGRKWVSGGRRPHCKGCSTGDPYDDQPWPCETVRALDGAEPEEGTL